MRCFRGISRSIWLLAFAVFLCVLSIFCSITDIQAQSEKPEGWHRLRTNSVPYQPNNVAPDTQGGVFVSAIDSTEYEPGVWYRPAGGQFLYLTPARRNNAVGFGYNPPIVKPELNANVLYAVRDKAGNTWYSLKNRKVLCEKPDKTWVVFNMPNSSDIDWPGIDTTNVDSAHRIRLIDKTDGSQELLLIARRGIVRVSASLSVVETRKVNQPYNNYFISDALIDSKGRYWIAYEMGLERGTGLTNTTYISILYPDEPSAPVSSGSVTRIVEDVAGNIWFGSDNYSGDGIYCFTTAGAWVKYKDGVVADIGKKVHNIAATSDGSVWFGSVYSANGGLLRYNASGSGSWTRFRGSTLGLQSEEILSLASDGQGIWFVTAYNPDVTGNGTGIHYMTLNQQSQPQITSFTYRGNSTTLTSLRYNSVAADKSGGVWFPAYDDTSIARLKTDGTWQQFRQAGDSTFGSYGVVGAATDSKNRVYFAPLRSAPVAYDVANERWLSLPGAPFSDLYYYGVYVDPQDGKWFYGAYGVFHLNADNTTWTTFSPTEIPGFPGSFFINDVLVDDAENVWFMCRSEIILRKKDPGGGSPVWFKFVSGDASGFTGGYRVYQDDSGQIWSAGKKKFKSQDNTWETAADTSAFDSRHLRFLNGRVRADMDLSAALPPVEMLDERLMTLDSRGTIYFVGGLGNVRAGIVAFGALNGDLNRDGKVDLADAIVSARAVASLSSSALAIGDVNNDGRIGLAEMIYILQRATGLR